MPVDRIVPREMIANVERRPRVSRRSHKRRPRSLTRVTRSSASEPHEFCRLAARLAASHYELPLADIRARTRSRRAARARHVAMYLAHVAYGLNLGAIGAGFGRDRKTAAYACRVIEDARDDPAFDATLAGLELTAGILLQRERGETAA